MINPLLVTGAKEAEKKGRKHWTLFLKKENENKIGEKEGRRSFFFLECVRETEMNAPVQHLVGKEWKGEYGPFNQGQCLGSTADTDSHLFRCFFS